MKMKINIRCGVDEERKLKLLIFDNVTDSLPDCINNSSPKSVTGSVMLRIDEKTSSSRNNDASR